MIFKNNNNSYKKESLLGQGLNSLVYKGVKKDSKTGLTHKVALKVIQSKELTDLWKKEFESLSCVDSPYCVSVLGWDWEKTGQPCLILEYIEGISLKDLYFYAQLTEKEIIYLLTEIHKGLNDLKDAGIFHGDLNLSNVLMSKKAQIKLIDFGLGSIGETYQLASPGFSAPEILSSKEKPSYLTDLYSLGKISEHLRGQRDFEVLKKIEKNLLEKRSFERVDLEEKKLIQESLKKHIDLCLEKKSLKGTTMMIIRKSSSFVFKKTYLAGFIFCVLFYCFYFKIWEKASLSIRTLKWVSVRMNGFKIPSPSNKDSFTPGIKIIFYESNRGKAFKILTLKGGSHRVLNDEFFFKNP